MPPAQPCCNSGLHCHTEAWCDAGLGAQTVFGGSTPGVKHASIGMLLYLLLTLTYTALNLAVALQSAPSGAVAGQLHVKCCIKGGKL